MSVDPKILERLSAYLDGALSDRDRAAVEAALAAQPAWRQALEELKTLRGDLKGLPPLTPPEAFYARVMRDIEETPQPVRRPFLAYVPMKTLGALAAAMLVVVALQDAWKPARQREQEAAPSPIQMFQMPATAQQAVPKNEAPAYQKAPAAARMDAVSSAVDAAPAPLPLKKSAAAAEGKSFKDADKAVSLAGAAAGEDEGRTLDVPAATLERDASLRWTEERKERARMKAEAAPAALGATASEKDAADEDVPRQWRGAHSAVAAPETIVAGTPAQWAALWARHAPGAPAPDVDFSRWAAVAVFAGEKPSGGHAVEILSVQDSGETVVVAFRESGPGADAFASQALTAPFHIRLIPKTRGQVRFRKVP